MKILIVSDSHGNQAALKAAIERERPDRVFHLGDMIADARRLAAAWPELTVECVLGNCDGWDNGTGADELMTTVGGVRFFLAHGHRYHVKLGIGMIVSEGRKKGADVVCFGHTHQALCELRPGGLWVVNPGSVGGVHAPATCAVAEVENGAVTAEIKYL